MRPVGLMHAFGVLHCKFCWVQLANYGGFRFLKSPSEVFINCCTKKQLLQMAEHNSIDVSDKKCKDEIKSAV